MVKYYSCGGMRENKDGGEYVWHDDYAALRELLTMCAEEMLTQATCTTNVTDLRRAKNLYNKYEQFIKEQGE